MLGFARRSYDRILLSPVRASSQGAIRYLRIALLSIPLPISSLIPTSPASTQTQVPPTVVAGHGKVMLSTPSDNQITSLTTTIIVPPKHSAIGTLFLWPGFQPGGANYLPIDNGVLQPVLSWGLS